MLRVFHLIIIMIYNILVYVFGSICCLFNLRNPKYIAIFGHMFGHLAPLFGLKVECRKPADTENYDNTIYVVNHQSNYNMMTASSTVQPPAVMVGKRNLLWTSLSGQLYWLAGNLLIDGNSRTKTRGTIAKVVNHLKKRRISIWMFPEEACNRGRGLLPFKIEVFRAAIATDVLATPVYVSTASNRINLNRLHDGPVIVEALPPIDVSQYGRDQVRELAAHYRSIMEQEIAGLDREVAEREATGKV